MFDFLIPFLIHCILIFCPPKHKKKSLQKLRKIPLDHHFSDQQVFALWNWDSFIVWNFLIFENVKLCRMKKYPRDSS